MSYPTKRKDLFVQIKFSTFLCFIFEASRLAPKFCWESWPFAISCSDVPFPLPKYPGFAANGALAIELPSPFSSLPSSFASERRRQHQYVLLSISCPSLKLTPLHYLNQDQSNPGTNKGSLFKLGRRIWNMFFWYKIPLYNQI